MGTKSKSRVAIVVSSLQLSFKNLPLPPPPCLSRSSINSGMQSEGKNYNSLAKSFHFSGDFVVSTWHSYAGQRGGEQ